MRRKKERKPRPDLRKIPKFFRAVERGDSYPDVFVGHLLEDHDDKFVCAAVKASSDETHFFVRVLNKREYDFSAVSVEEFDFYAKIGIRNAEKARDDKRLELDRDESELAEAKRRLQESLEDR